MEFKFLHKWIFTSERFGVSFKDLVKETLEYLKVPYTDTCCDQVFDPNVPMGVPNPHSKVSITEDEVSLEAVKVLFEEIQKLKEEIAELKKAQNN